MIRSILVLALVVAVAQAQVTNGGGCPVVKPMPNVDITKLQGRWFRQFEYNAGRQPQIVCAQYNVEVINATYIKIVAREIDLPTREEKNYVGYAIYNSTLSTFAYESPTSKATYTLLRSDYTGLAIISSCSNGWNQHTRNVLVMTRVKFQGPKDILENFQPINGSSININDFGSPTQYWCPLPKA